MGNEKDLMTDHNYDGIRELDHPLPSWWLWTFLFSIIFAFLYWIHYESGSGETQSDELKRDMAKIESIRRNRPAPNDSEEELNGLLASAAALEEGREVFASKCAACHGPQLQGLIGPNLTDEFWINGGKITDIVTVIRKGVLDKGMPPWEGQLRDGEIKAVAAFIVSQKGSNPPNPKAPQGNKVVSN